MSKKEAPPLVALNGNDPVDLSAMLVMGMAEFFGSHMNPESAQKNFANFMASIATELFSEKGLEYLDKGREKYQQMFEAARDPASN